MSGSGCYAKPSILLRTGPGATLWKIGFGGEGVKGKSSHRLGSLLTVQGPQRGIGQRRHFGRYTRRGGFCGG